jgi:NAD(P)-dependent dehydrogenase (short-subunit alcohol dehydrogenase family)
MGGLLTSYAGLSYIFVVNVPIGALALLLAPRVVPESRLGSKARRYDPLGALTATGALVVAVYAISRAPQAGWATTQTLALLTTSAVLFIGFFVVETRVAAPLLPLRLFRLNTVAGSNAVSFLLTGSFYTFVFVGTLYMAQVLGFSALETGLAWLAASITSVTRAVLRRRGRHRLQLHPGFNRRSGRGLRTRGRGRFRTLEHHAAARWSDRRRRGIDGRHQPLPLAAEPWASPPRRPHRRISVGIVGVQAHRIGRRACRLLPYPTKGAGASGRQIDATRNTRSRYLPRVNPYRCNKGAPMTITDLTSTTAIVTGASRGFGRAIAVAFAKSGAHVVGVARGKPALDELREQLGGTFDAVTADVTDPELAARLISDYEPRTLVLAAGATPAAAPISQQTWDTFRVNWHTDARHVFHFTRQALVRPLEPGSTVIALSSGAVVRGSPLSGGYAGAKATIRFISAYAATEAQRRSLDIRFVSLLPQITPAGGVGAAFVAAYADFNGMATEQYLAQFGGTLTAEEVGRSAVELATDGAHSMPAYLLTTDGISPAP